MNDEQGSEKHRFASYPSKFKKYQIFYSDGLLCPDTILEAYISLLLFQKPGT